LAFPTSIEAAEYFGNVYNNLATTLSAVCGISDTTVYVASTDNFPTSGWFTIEDEVRSYTGKTAGSFTGCTPGADDTTAAEHAAGKAVSLTLPAIIWNRLVTALRALMTKVGADSSAVTTTHDYKLSGVTGEYKAVSTLHGVTLADDQTIASVKTFDEGAIVHAPKTYTPDSAGTATLDLSLGNRHDITMPAGNITIAISNATAGQVFEVSITQDGTGSRTVTWFTTIKWADGSAPTLTTTGDKRDVFVFIVTGEDTYDGFIAGQNL